MAAIDHPKTRQQTFNIRMDEPVDYGMMDTYIEANYHLPTIGVRTEFHSTWLDNSKAKFLLNGKSEYNLKKLIDSAWHYERHADNPRIVWYPS